MPLNAAESFIRDFERWLITGCSCHNRRIRYSLRMKEKWNIWLAIILMVVFAITRWPGLMWQNFSAAYAIAFCAGVYFPPKLRWILPLCTLLGTNILLNIFYYKQPVFHLATLGSFAGFAALIWLGTRFSKKNSWLSLLGGGLLGAIFFYLISNFASWLYDPGYPKTLAGLIQALTVGTPGWPHTWEFFRSTLLSGGLFTGLFCGAMKLSEQAEEAEEKEEEAVPEGATEEAGT
jgi:hypothetical protein